MSDARSDEAKFNETLKRMLESPPKPHETKSSKRALTDADHKKKPGGPSAKKDRPES